MEELEIEFPVWIVRTDDGSEDGLKIVSVSNTTRGSCLPVFTDTDLADRFINARHDAHKELRYIKIEDARSLGVIVGSLAQDGCQYVMFDYSNIRNHISASFVPVDQILDECSRRAT